MLLALHAFCARRLITCGERELEFARTNNSLTEAIRLQRTRQSAEAEAVCRQILLDEPENGRACQLLARVLHETRRAEEAIAWLQRAAELEPASAVCRCNLAAALGMLDRHSEAEKELREAIRLDPNSAQARNNLGVALEHLERYAEAVENLQEAVRLSPTDTHAWVNLSNSLRKNGQPCEALEAAKRSAELDARNAEAYNAIGAALLELNRLDEAAGAFAQTIEVMPGHVEARVNGAMALLMRGDWLNGFRAFECRFQHTAWRRQLPGKRWVAPAVASKQPSRILSPPGAVLLYGEGGLGNEIQFARYATRIAETGVKVVIECRPELSPLLRTVPGVSAVVGRGQPLPSYDCYAALMSLPALLGVDQTNAAAGGAYLTAEPDRVKKWGDLLNEVRVREARENRRLVGVSWQGERTPAHRRNRSVPVGQLARLAALPGVRLVSLQKGCGFDHSFPMTELPGLDEQGGAFLDTAAVMTQLDLIVTCDTSTAHLAGALARPTWVALPFAADWRWMRDREDTPWYPTMRLFRQESPGDWDRLFGQIANALLSGPKDQFRTWARGRGPLTERESTAGRGLE